MGRILDNEQWYKHILKLVEISHAGKENILIPQQMQNFTINRTS